MPRTNGTKIKRIFLLIGCENFRNFPQIPAHHDLYAFMRLARQTQHAQVRHLSNPKREDVKGWVTEQIHQLAHLASQDAVLVLFVSTHGFEFNGQTHFAWHDSDRDQPNTTMTTLSSLQDSASHWFYNKTHRKAFLIQQTCRENLDPAQLPLPIQLSAEVPNGQWSILAAVPAGQAEEGWETLSQRNRNEYSPAGRLIRRFIALWKDLTQSIPLSQLAEELNKIYRQEGKEPPHWIALDEQLVWPHIQRIQPEPPKDFVGSLFRPLGEKDALYGRDTALRTALGVRYDRDFNQVGWLFSSNQTLLVGPSGAGKTSFVCAGLFPWLRKSSLPESNVHYIDVSTQGIPSFSEESNLPNCLFLDQVEGCLLNKALFDELAKCVQVCKEKSIRLVILLREEFLGAWECQWQEKPDMEFANRILLPLMKEEAQEVLYAILPSSCLTSQEREQVLDEVAQASSQTASNSTFGTYSPVLLQAATADAWQRRELPEGQRVRSLKEFWREQWQNVIETSPIEKQSLVAVLSAFVPLAQHNTSRRRLTKQELFTWLAPRGLSKEQIQQSCNHLVQAHWLREFQHHEGHAYILSHDVLLPFLFAFLEKDNDERERRFFFRRIQEALYNVEPSNLLPSLRHFTVSEWKRLHKEASFWWQWLYHEDYPTTLTQHDFTNALHSLLTQRRYRLSQLLSAVIMFLLLAGVWLWNTSVTSRLLSDMERCTEAPEATLPLEKFLGCSKALVIAEKWWWRSQDLKEKIAKLFEAFQAKNVPMEWWKMVPSTLEPTRRLLLPSLHSEGGVSALGWVYLLNASLQHPYSSGLQEEERTELLRLLQYSDESLRGAALKVWKAWIKKTGVATQPERDAWRHLLLHSNPYVHESALGVWRDWIEKTGVATQQERDAWLRLLQHSNWYVRESALGVWKAWIAKTGVATQQERDAWLRLLLHSNEYVRRTALEVWRAWIAKTGVATQQERDAWLRLLQHSNEHVRFTALWVWKAWIEKTGVATQQDRDAWRRLLLHSEVYVRHIVLGVWEAWIKKTGVATQPDRDAWLRLLQHSNWHVRFTALGVWEAWIAKTGEATQPERDALLRLLQHSNKRVRGAALEVWRAWIAKTGVATQQERDAWLRLLQHSNWYVHESALGVWEAWIEKTGVATQQERDAWLRLLQHSNEYVHRTALGVWRAWIAKTGVATQQERDAWLRLLQHSNEHVRRAALGVWKAWIEKTGVATQPERSALLRLLQDSDWRVRGAALMVWRAWIEKTGVATQPERDAWLRLFKDSNKRVRDSALGVWEAWIKKTGVATQPDRDAWLRLLQHSNTDVRDSALDVWKAWIKKTGVTTQLERSALLHLLQDSNKRVRFTALMVWEAWIKKTGVATQQDRDAWLRLLQHSNEHVRFTALRVWKAWIKKTGVATQLDRDAWLRLLLHSEVYVRHIVLGVWKAWGRASVLRLFKQEAPTVQRLEEWLKQTVTWHEVEGGLEALKEHLTSHLKLTKELPSSPYPLFQIAARQALLKKTSSHRSLSTTSRPVSRPSSRPSSIPASQTSTSTSHPISAP